MYISDFQIIRPQYETAQKDTLDWLVEAHVKAEGGDEAFREKMKERLWKVGCKPDRIATRGHVLGDYLHRDWDRMEIFRLLERSEGADLGVRLKKYCEHADRVFEEFYETATAPDDLIHVTCTGYASPSGAQKVVSKRNWGEKTSVTHAYHMGCYGSIPALRMAKGFLLSDESKRRADIVHTEICSLQANPSKHETDQLVSQSLFADGFIKYSVSKKPDGLKLLATREEIIPNSTAAMTWNVVEWGFEMSLAKEVPVLIARTLKGYMERLRCDWKQALFAVHPGGPKILTHVQEILGLTDEQMAYSFGALSQYGNMSSATLPHIWKKMLDNAEDGRQVVSLAFGPGLSICGAVMEKQ